MRFKTAFMLAIGSACLLALSIVDFRHPPPDRAQPQRARSDAGTGKGTQPVEPPRVVLPRQVRLPPLPPAWRGAAGFALVAEARKYLGTNPTRRKRLWCATFMNLVLAKLGYAGTKSDVARSFLHYGRRLSGPRIGAIAVLTRGKEGGHVGVVAGVDKHRNPILISGNFNRSVGIGVYPRARVIAYVAPTGAARVSRGRPTAAHAVRASAGRTASRSRHATSTRTGRELAQRGQRCDLRSGGCRRVAGIERSASALQARAEVQP